MCLFHAIRFKFKLFSITYLTLPIIWYFFQKVHKKTMMDNILKTLKQIVTQKLMVLKGFFHILWKSSKIICHHQTQGLLRLLIVARVFKIYHCPLKENSSFNIKSTWGTLSTNLFPKKKEKKKKSCSCQFFKTPNMATLIYVLKIYIYNSINLFCDGPRRFTFQCWASMQLKPYLIIKYTYNYICICQSHV